jgi:hypothetical protein
MSSNHTADAISDLQATGTAREFADFCRGERQRYVNTAHEADPALFDEAVAYVLQKLSAQAQGAQA